MNEVTRITIDRALQLHRDLGPGLLESAYEMVLARALEKRGLHVERQKPVRFEYDGIVFDEGFRVDLFLEREVVVELKSLEHMGPVHPKQVLTYLRLMGKPVGLLINFGCARLKDGLTRVVNNLDPCDSLLLRVNKPGSRGDAEPRRG